MNNDLHNIIQNLQVKNPSNKNNYNVDFLEKLKKLASEPKDNNTFLIEDYNGLSRILDIYQKKTFKGTETKLDFTMLL